MKKFFIIMCVLIFGYACTIPVTKQDVIQPKDIISKSIPEKNLDVYEQGWTYELKYFWISNYYASLAAQPNVRARFKPISTWRVSKCVIEYFQVNYSFNDFTTRWGSQTQISPADVDVIWNASYACSQTELARVLKELEEAKGKPQKRTLKNTI